MKDPNRLHTSVSRIPFDGRVQIQMHDDWLDGIGQLDDTSRSAYHEMVSFYDGDAHEKSLYPVGCLQLALAVHLVDAMAAGPELKIYHPYDHLPDATAAPTENDTIIRHYPEIHLYGYFFSNNPAIPYAFGVLLAHVIIALVHMVVILASPRPLRGSCWGSFGQILILALRSRAPQGLDNVGGGVESART